MESTRGESTDCGRGVRGAGKTHVKQGLASQGGEQARDRAVRVQQASFGHGLQ
jgi:hypothetical protein